MSDKFTKYDIFSWKIAIQLRFNSFVMKIFSKSTCNCPVAYSPIHSSLFGMRSL